MDINGEGDSVEFPEVPDLFNAITQRIIGCAFKVSNTLGCGFLERIYENALVHEMQKQGLAVKQQCETLVYYDDVVVGRFIADVIVNDTVLIELKSTPAIDNPHLAQTLNYLKALNLPLGLILNFGTPKIEIRRVINQHYRP